MNYIKAMKDGKSFKLNLVKQGEMEALYLDNDFKDIPDNFDQVTVDGKGASLTMPGYKQPTTEMFIKRILNKSTISQDALKINMPALQMAIGSLDFADVYEFSRNTTGVLGKSKAVTDDMKTEIEIEGGYLTAVPKTQILDIPKGFVDENIHDSQVLAMISALIAEKFEKSTDVRMLNELDLAVNAVTGADALEQVQKAISDYEILGDIMDAVVYVSSDIFVALAGQKNVSTAAPASAGAPYDEFLINGVIRVKRAKALTQKTILISELGNIVIGIHGTPDIFMDFMISKELIGYRTASEIAVAHGLIDANRTKLYEAQ